MDTINRQYVVRKSYPKRICQSHDIAQMRSTQTKSLSRQSLPLHKHYIGPRHWESAFDISLKTKRDLPEEMVRFLNSQCVFNPKMKVIDTHIVCYIPSKVNNKMLTLAYFIDELLPNIKGKRKEHAKIYDYSNKFKGVYEGREVALLNTGLDDDRWVVMYAGKGGKKTGVIPNSRSKIWNKQCQLLNTANKKMVRPYEKPRAFKMVICTLMNYIVTGVKILGDHPVTYTRCDEQWSKDGYGAYHRVDVGWLDMNGIDIDESGDWHKFSNLGLSATQTF